VIRTPKFYFADVGVVDHLARRGLLEPGAELFGRAFESRVSRELAAYRAYRDFALELAYWRLASGLEMDFIVDDFRLAVEARAAKQVHADHLKGLRALVADHRVCRRVVVSLDQHPRRTDDGIDVLPVRMFLQRFWADDLLGR
jgi:uncharacterized protein